MIKNNFIKLKNWIFFVSIFLIKISFAQPFQRFDYLRVSNNNTLLQYPWTGGLGAVLFGKTDVNNDGLKDLIVYDKTNNKYCILLAQTNSSTQFKYERKYASYFPDIRGWLILKDYNCDGIEDLFTASENGRGSITVYIGFYKNDTLNFKLQQESLYYNTTVNVFSAEILKPAIYDYNGDGDLDVIGFNSSGSRLIYYENQQRELALNCDSLYFNKTDVCFGNIQDTFSSSFALRDTCEFKFGLREEQILHSGSVVECYDVDNNGAADILIGSISINHITMLYNFGTNNYASILKQDIAYPSYNTSFNLSSFGSPYFIDANNDNKTDLLVSNFDISSSNINNIWYYKNTSNDSINLVLQNKNFILENTIDAGDNSYPCIFDVDGDGLKDILLGSSGFRNLLNPSTIYKLQFYKNIGTATYPEFNLVNDDFLNLSALNVKDLVPTAGDIDNDGDTDIVVGISDGRMIYWQNIANIGNTPNYTYKGILKNNNNVDINVGANATPFLTDLNRDGKTDLIIGERNGNINYYQGNVIDSAKFSFVTDSVGKILTTVLNNRNGYSQPVIKDINNDGKLDIIVGTNLLGLLFYSNIEDSISERILSLSPFITDNLGNRTTTSIDDITNDGNLEIVTGNISGGLHIYSQNPPTFIPTTIKNNLIQNLDFNVFPNPSNNFIYLNIESTKNNLELMILNYLGQKIVHQQYSKDKTIEINTQQLPNGIYLIKISDGEKEGIKKLIIQH